MTGVYAVFPGALRWMICGSTSTSWHFLVALHQVSSIYAVLPPYPRLADAIRAEWGGEAGQGCILIAARVEKPTFSAHPLPVSKLSRSNTAKTSNGISDL
ncbi:hypothetical protein B0H11DRAFT_185365 [Mycena galericulata]|nr:hypothetical protein B0H11DRAFT_185365 [Mycena galericulata]